MKVGEPFWFRLGRGKRKTERVRSPSPDEKPAPALSHPSFCEGGKQSGSPSVAGCTAALPSRTRQTEAGRRGGTSERLQPAGSRVPQGWPGVCVCWGEVSPYLVRVPQADGAAKGKLPHQQVVHPTEGKLQVFHLVPPEVIMYLL